MSDKYIPYTVSLRSCGDCAALPGYEHGEGCDVARCPLCGIQRLQCYKHSRSTKPSIWTGIWPGKIECVEHNLWVKEVTRPDPSGVFPYRHVRWEKVTRDDPDAIPDLNELMRLFMTGQLIWDIRLQRITKRDSA